VNDLRILRTGAAQRSEDAASRASPSGGAGVLRLGFRPFYLLASIYAALAIPLWAIRYAGWLREPSLGPLWHAHEMLFGYTVAVVAGFLFTAVRNWTARPTPTGLTLASICALWIAGRALALTPFGWTSAFVNAAFPIVVAVGIGIPLIRAGNRRNYFFIVLLLAIAVAELVVQTAALGALALPPWLGVQIALDVILFIMTVMAGRVVPMFTNNGVPGANAIRLPWLEKAVLGVTIAVLAADIIQAPALLLAAITFVAALLHGARLALWKPWRTLRVPIVWSLHVAYAWIIVHLAMRSLAALDLVPAPLATHALTIGAIGGLTLAMMTRTARGHTGRPLTADRFDVAAYLLVLVAALVRVAGPVLDGSHYVATVFIAAASWSAAFAIYAIRYWPSLTSPRADGKQG
jgi:uncharacterized protein involved in response to NO